MLENMKNGITLEQLKLEIGFKFCIKHEINDN